MIDSTPQRCLLDTDHVTILQQAGPECDRLLERISDKVDSDFFVSIITFHEQVMGANKYISAASDSAGVVKGYDRLHRILALFSRSQIAVFDASAEDQFVDMRRRKIRIGTMDLRIAAIALAGNMAVLTRNVKDFQRVPGLRVEDWTLPA